MEANYEHLSIKISEDRMSAQIECQSDHPLPLDQQAIKELLTTNKIGYGVHKETLEKLTSITDYQEFPIVIATGLAPVDGVDGKLELTVDLGVQMLENSDEYDFREVMRIPSVSKGEKLAYVIPASPGQDGKDVFGNDVKARDGKTPRIIAGKNVVYKEDDCSFYATDEGEVKLVDQSIIHVNTVYEIHESISMRTGNIDFPGSVIIHGDVPSGYRVRAKGDIKVFGLVEAATLNAVGSIFISEGFSGMRKGTLIAGEDVQAGYINQGIVRSGKSIVAENSILHSECIANEMITCVKGNIIGGIVLAGTLIEAKDLGNRLSTKTEVIFGLKEDHAEKEKEYLNEMEVLLEEKDKLTSLGEQIMSRDYSQNPRLRIALLRQRNRLQAIVEQIEDLAYKIEQLKGFDGKEHQAKLKIREYLYPNTIISFGKYKQTIQKDFYAIEVSLTDNEIKLYNM